MRVRNAILTAATVLITIMLLCVAVKATYDPEAGKTALSVIGAWCVTYVIMRVVLWLDEPRRGR